MGAEIFCARWTPLVLRELLCGSTKFNDIRRGVPRMSPTLLSKRLKELEKAGIIARGPGKTDYMLTPAGEDLRSVVMSLGSWGQRWVDSKLSLRNLDPTLLMWDMRRNLDPKPLPPRRCTVFFHYPDLEGPRRFWWLVIENGGVDLCLVDPGHEVDLRVKSSLRVMTAIWMGYTTVKAEIEAGRLDVDGEPAIARSFDKWLGLSPFAREMKRA
ncbi:helix-turn-helix domain-containing protein [Bradyrhizobium sp. G127]|uniref:winged helix-turn-helix transcriptional regulator n=1 Tax=Bradyrhizobium sp. G127 TaxID=2904800 RepID=UPI001F2884EB|nr:helix-turn-helix domain-containing protein [Bradyrhizobium sp. G127]MCF2522523.1 helix-turn-helix transcriptional regulator [Bradyrhizobium sp. G127]